MNAEGGMQNDETPKPGVPDAIKKWSKAMGIMIYQKYLATYGELPTASADLMGQILNEPPMDTGYGDPYQSPREAYEALEGKRPDLLWTPGSPAAVSAKLLKVEFEHWDAVILDIVHTAPGQPPLGTPFRSLIFLN